MVVKSSITAAQKAVKNSVHDFCFYPALRLCDKSAINHVFQLGKKKISREFNVFFYPNQLLYPRICISISKKQISKACQRNTIKRLFRESFRLNQHSLPHYDIVIVVYKSISLLEKKQIPDMIKKQWQRLTATFNMA